MKFWKTLSSLIEQTLPDWRDKFLSYKDLKKQLKLICPKHAAPAAACENSDENNSNINRNSSCYNNRPKKRSRIRDVAANADGSGAADKSGDHAKSAGERETYTRSEVGTVAEDRKEVNEFGKLLEEEIEKFNAFFEEKEEEYVIRLKELQDRVAKADDSTEEMMKVGREIVDFHGEMVLLENYSALNYTGLVKILKKYDKRSGTLLRLPFIQKVVQQSFYSNETLCQLEKECESMLDHLFAKTDMSESSLEETKTTPEGSGLTEAISADKSSDRKDKQVLLTVPKELSEIENMESMYYRLTLSALRVLKEIRSGSSTVSVFSLPPLQSSPQEEEAWKKISVQEQEAK